MSLEYNKKLIPDARELRKNMTKQEKRLWYDFLAKYPARFQRQKTIGNFIVDFYCYRAKLVIELDGNSHFTEEGIKYDIRRSMNLESFGLKVLRFTDYEVDANFVNVCMSIHIMVEKRMKIPSNSPSHTAP